MTSSTAPQRDWGHFAGMLALMAGTAGFWLVVLRYAKRARGSG